MSRYHADITIKTRTNHLQLHLHQNNSTVIGKQLTWLKSVFSIRALTILASLGLYSRSSFAVIIGVLMFFFASMISFIRGTPSVTSTMTLR